MIEIILLIIGLIAGFVAGYFYGKAKTYQPADVSAIHGLTTICNGLVSWQGFIIRLITYL